MAISFQASLDQTTDGSSIDVGSGSFRCLLVLVMARGGAATSVTFNGVAMTQVGITDNSSNAGPAADYNLWILANPDSGSHVIQSNGGGTVRIAALALNGVDQVTPYRVGSEAASDFGSTSNPTISVTVNNDNAWVAGYLCNAVGSASAGTNTQTTGASQYIMGWTPTAQAVGSRSIGLSGTTAGCFLACEIIPFVSPSRGIIMAA